MKQADVFEAEIWYVQVARLPTTSTEDPAYLGFISSFISSQVDHIPVNLHISSDVFTLKYTLIPNGNSLGLRVWFQSVAIKKFQSREPHGCSQKT